MTLFDEEQDGTHDYVVTEGFLDSGWFNALAPQ